MPHSARKRTIPAVRRSGSAWARPEPFTSRRRRQMKPRPTLDHCALMWRQFASTIGERLTDEDDLGLWEVAIDHILSEAEYLCRQSARRPVVLLQIGRCSHWRRPHQHRWTADGGFAAPFGYGSHGWNIHGVPVFDWSYHYRRDWATGTWALVDDFTAKGAVVLRVTLPSRTMQHAQAAVHTLWAPGPPTAPNKEVLQLYGFRREDGRWRCTASEGGDRFYEAAAT